LAGADIWHLKCETAPVNRSFSAATFLMNSATPSHFFTVDVEEYFQVRALESVVSRHEWSSRSSRLEGSIIQLLQLLDRHQATGTFFVLGWVARHRPEVVRSIAAAGHEIASHGYWHQRVSDLSKTAFREDVRISREALEDLVGAAVLGYRAPNFSIVPGLEWAFDILLEEGYRYDSSLFPIRRRGYGYPNCPRVPHFIARAGRPLAEFPMATTSILRYPVPAAGGGYLRQFPFSIIKRAFREASARGQSATFYIHPWEIDADQPRLAVSPLTKVRHYRGLASTLGRMDQLLSEFSFTSIREYLPQLTAHSTSAASAGAA
jgi:polysaccharide deacetylase family protein (PEP-CTERM system associated)